MLLVKYNQNVLKQAEISANGVRTIILIQKHIS